MRVRGRIGELPYIVTQQHPFCRANTYLDLAICTKIPIFIVTYEILQIKYQVSSYMKWFHIYLHKIISPILRTSLTIEYDLLSLGAVGRIF